VLLEIDRLRAARLEFDLARRHLPGQHDQSTHAGKGGPAGQVLPLGAGSLALQRAYKEELGDAPSTDGMTMLVMDDDGVRIDAKMLVAERIEARMAEVPTQTLVEEMADPRLGAIAMNEVDARAMLLRDGDDVEVPELGYVKLGPRFIDKATAGDLVDEAWQPGADRAAIDKMLREQGWAPVGSPEAETALRRMMVGELVHQWAITSNDSDPRSLAMQETAARVFDVKGHADWPASSYRDSERRGLLADYGSSVYEPFLRAQYAETQDFLARHNIAGMTLVRGMQDVPTLRGADDRAVSYPRVHVGTVTAAARPLSAWSASPSVGVRFAHGESLPGDGTGEGAGSAVLAARVPASRIFSTPLSGSGCLAEDEVVVLGGSFPVRYVFADSQVLNPDLESLIVDEAPR